MNCPKCENEMSRGTMHTRNRPCWTQQELRFFKSPTDTVYFAPHGDNDASMFTRDPFLEFPDAWLCKACDLVTFSCNPIEKKK